MAKSTIQVSILAETQKMRQGIDEANRQLTNFGQSASRLGGTIKGAFAAAGAAIIASGVVEGFKQIVNAASELQQTTGAVQAIYKDYAGGVIAQSNKAAQAVGLSASSYQSLASLIGSQMKNAGTSLDKLGPKTDNVIKLGADLAAQFGGSTKEAVEAYSSALKGEMDPIERYGVSLNDNAVKAEIAAKGYDKLKGATENSAKQAAVASIIMRQTADAQGAFGREANTYAGQTERLKAQFENLKATVGSGLLPVLTKMVSFVNTNLGPAFKAVKETFDLFRSGITLSGENAAEFGDELTGLVKFGAQVRSGFDKVRQVFSDLVAGFTLGRDEAKSFGSDLTGFVAVGSILRDGFNKVVETLRNVASAFGGIIDAAKGFYEAYVPIVLQVVGALVKNWSKIQPYIKSIWTSVSEIIIGVLNIIANVVRKVTAVVKFIWNKWGSDILTFVIRVFNGVLQTISGVLKVISGVVKFVLAVLKGDWSGAWSAIKQIVSGAIQAIKGVISVGMSVVKGTFSGAWGAIKAVFSGAGSFLRNAGENMINGLIGGIKSMASRAARAASDAVGDAINAAKRKLGIASPSKVFKGIGKNVVLGLAGGLKDTGIVARAADRLASTTIGAYGTGFSSPALAAAGSGATYNVTIQALDTQDAVRAFRRIQDQDERKNGKR